MSSLGNASLHYGSVLRLNEILSDHGKEFSLSGGVECTSWNQKIEFANVSLKYPNSTSFALDNLSFTIEKGTTVAFVGLSGAGKSSILDLILRLRDPSQGEIFIDTLPLKSLSQESWRKKIGVVSQDTFVFNESIEENIRFGDLKAPKEAIQKAAKLAGAAPFIQHLPDGYQTIVGERGHKLSGGEKQRIALARAALREPEILILDEATSSLDSISEEIIQKSLDRIQNAKTTIVVAHRLSTIVHADQIFVLEKGKIIEKGRHADLLAQNGQYAKLWSFQSNR
jgi:ATP-binding cassette subfamily B protein/subfamily B ATP-binding cassette protein MsbA